MTKIGTEKKEQKSEAVHCTLAIITTEYIICIS